jgi:hypothetical protein
MKRSSSKSRSLVVQREVVRLLDGAALTRAVGGDLSAPIPTHIPAGCSRPISRQDDHIDFP